MAVTDHSFRLPTTEETIANLQRLIDFGPEDIESNEKGKLSPRQRSNILHNDIAVPIFWSSLMVLGGWAVHTMKRLISGAPLMDALTSFIGLPSFLRTPVYGETVDGPLGFWLGLVPYGIVLLAIYRLPWNLFLDLALKKVKCAEGKLDIEMRGVNDRTSSGERRAEWQHEVAAEKLLTGRSQSYEDWNDAQSDYSLKINGMKFPVSKELVVSIDEGDWYRAFYTAFSHRLVSLEPKRKQS